MGELAICSVYTNFMPAAEAVILSKFTTEQRLKLVMQKTAALLPSEVGQQLLAILGPGSLATIALTLFIWAGSHFFGAGELADLVLLSVGYAALGGVALQAGQQLFQVIEKILNGKTQADLDEAAHQLAKAISLIGVQAVLAVLLRQKPSDIFKQPFRSPLPAYRTAYPKALPRVGPVRYHPTTVFTRSLDANRGATNIVGDIRVGRKFYPETPNPTDLVRETLFHEKVHQFLIPKLYLFREVRIYVAQSAYRRSFILRYLEESLAETIALLRVHGFDPRKLQQGFRFAVDENYQLSFQALGHEANGLLLGPVMAGGMVYNVFYGEQEKTQ